MPVRTPTSVCACQVFRLLIALSQSTFRWDFVANCLFSLGAAPRNSSNAIVPNKNDLKIAKQEICGVHHRMPARFQQFMFRWAKVPDFGMRKSQTSNIELGSDTKGFYTAILLQPTSCLGGLSTGIFDASSISKGKKQTRRKKLFCLLPWTDLQTTRGRSQELLAMRIGSEFADIFLIVYTGGGRQLSGLNIRAEANHWCRLSASLTYLINLLSLSLKTPGSLRKIRFHELLSNQWGEIAYFLFAWTGLASRSVFHTRNAVARFWCFSPCALRMRWRGFKGPEYTKCRHIHAVCSQNASKWRQKEPSFLGPKPSS